MEHLADLREALPHPAILAPTGLQRSPILTENSDRNRGRTSWRNFRAEHDWHPHSRGMRFREFISHMVFAVLAKRPRIRSRSGSQNRGGGSGHRSARNLPTTLISMPRGGLLCQLRRSLAPLGPTMRPSDSQQTLGQEVPAFADI